MNFVAFMSVPAIICMTFAVLRLRAVRRRVLRARREAAAILGQAHGASVDIRPYDGPLSSRLFSGTLYLVLDDGLLIALKEPAPIPEGSTVTVWFRTRESDGGLFQWFRARVRELRPGRDPVLVLETPERIELGQKRLFDRAAPPAGCLNTCAVWRLGRSDSLPASRDAAGEPLCVARPGSGDFSVANISAAGAALSFEGEDRPFGLLPGDRLLFFLSFRMPGEEGNVFFWAASEVVNVRPDEGRSLVSMKFTDWAGPDDPDGSLFWLVCRPESGAAPVARLVEALLRNA